MFCMRRLFSPHFMTIVSPARASERRLSPSRRTSGDANVFSPELLVWVTATCAARSILPETIHVPVSATATCTASAVIADTPIISSFLIFLFPRWFCFSLPRNDRRNRHRLAFSSLIWPTIFSARAAYTVADPFSHRSAPHARHRQTPPSTGPRSSPPKPLASS